MNGPVLVSSSGRPTSARPHSGASCAICSTLWRDRASLRDRRLALKASFKDEVTAMSRGFDPTRR